MEEICPYHRPTPVWLSVGSSIESQLPITNGSSNQREKARNRREREMGKKGGREREVPPVQLMAVDSNGGPYKRERKRGRGG